MKKHLFSGVLLSAIFLAVSSLYAAEVAYVEGKVEVQSTVEKLWKKAEVGMQVNIGDSIRTARRSKADIILDREKKQSIRVEEQTMVVLNSTSAEQINRLDLSEGKIYADVEQLVSGSSFEVTTPSGVAGVRGTALSVDSNSRRDEIVAYKDSIFVKAYDANKNLISDIVVPEGFKTIVGRFEKAGDLTKLIPGEKREGNRVIEKLSGLFEEELLQKAQEAVELIEDKTEENKNQIEEHGTEKEILDRHQEEEQQGGGEVGGGEY